MNIQFNQHPTPKCKAWLLYFFGALLRLSYGLSFLKEKQMVFSYFIFHGTKRVESKRYKVKWVGTGDGWFNQNWFGWDGDSMFSEFSHRLQFNLSYHLFVSYFFSTCHFMQASGREICSLSGPMDVKWIVISISHIENSFNHLPFLLESLSIISILCL